MKVALTYNLKRDAGGDGAVPADHYAEWDDKETIEAVRDALAARYGDVIMIEADEQAYFKLESSRPDMVFNMAEGLRGESREAQLPAIMEMLSIPYTGSSPLTLSLCLNKARAKEILNHYGIPTPNFLVAGSVPVEAGSSLRFPLIVKPLYEGSSKGIRNDSVVTNERELNEKVRFVTVTYGQPALVEEYLEGREFTVALLGNVPDVAVLPIVEINHSALPSGMTPIYSYEAKWVVDTPENPLEIFTCPAELDERLKRAVESVSRDAFTALGVRDWCRIDLRLDATGMPNVLELNPLPGILPDPRSNSCFPKAASAAGMDFKELVNTVVDIARARYGI